MQFILFLLSGDEAPKKRLRATNADVITKLEHTKGIETEMRREELQIQQRRLSLEERRFEIEREERLGMVQLLQRLANKLQ